MSFTLDTSAYSAFNRGDKRLRKWFTSDNDIVVPIIVIGELRAGFVAGNKRKTTVIYSQIYLRLRQKGKPIGTNDMWIAAIALEMDNELLTLDEAFSYIPDLMLGSI